jgi:hypothetical protein
VGGGGSEAFSSPDWASETVTTQFIAAFRNATSPEARGKFLSRVFGIFSEEIVRIWAADPRSPYEDLGRPTLRKEGEVSGSTLDFTFRSRQTGSIYPAELKCEIEYQDYKYFVLAETRQLDHHTKPAFAALLAAALKQPGLHAYVRRREVPIDGAILVWGAATDEGRAAVVRERGFFAVLTIGEIIADLQSWGSEPYRAFLAARRAWSNELYDALLPNHADAEPHDARDFRV